ncbi:alpha/beta fold hydrolase [Nocardia bovistercoris]|uniref:Alpha/beta fold hydrolase n=1 Tax=Nocardia bovistercoris TaxID=2785916 RepID=A0A931ID22_9NOCA|nr:alpha/beta fold hydrolase [Nocardia bovistercoris]MBH0778291.1 alpha/beta fold hydrolase [Nocardia bovistercoris]
MRALPPAMADLPGTIRRLLDRHRADLRSRTYVGAALNPPTARHEVIPVTTADGARLRVHAYGPADAPAIVLVHGWTCAIEYWNPQINAFADEYRVIAYDHRGHGASELGGAALTMDLLADDLAAVLDAALPSGERAVLVGHSLGGMTLQAWAGRYPEQVRRRAHAVLLCNTASGGLVAETTVVPLFNRPLRWFGRRVALPAAIGRRGLGTLLFFPPIPPMRWAFARQIMSPAAAPEIVDYCMAVVRSCPAAVRAKFGLLLADMDLGESARDLTVPTTILAGSADFMTPPVHSRRLADMLAETGALVRYEVLATGHLGNVEMYERFNEELVRILDAVVADAEIEAAG